MLHREERTSLKYAYFKHGDDIGVIELSCCLGFAGEPGTAIRVLAKMEWQELQRYFAMELGILGEVDLPHPTGTDALDDAIMPDYAAVCELNMRSGYVV